MNRSQERRKDALVLKKNLIFSDLDEIAQQRKNKVQKPAISSLSQVSNPYMEPNLSYVSAQKEMNMT